MVKLNEKINAHVLKASAGTLLALLLCVACEPTVVEQPKTPETYPQPQVEVTAAVENLYPLISPDINQGENLYIEECESCHGENGQGDGDNAYSLSMPATPLGEKDVMRTTQPVRWYMHVTYGDIGRGMPGFNNRLDSRERWDVVAYSTMLNYSESELEMGKTVFYESCESCHAETNGVKFASEVDGVVTHYWEDPAVLPRMSDNDIWEEVTRGINTDMPSFEASLTEEERWAVTSYVRALSYLGTMSLMTSTDAESELSDYLSVENGLDVQNSVTADMYKSTDSTQMLQNDEPEMVSVMVSGNVMHSSGVPLTSLNEAILLTYDNTMQENVLESIPLQDDGSYRFDPFEIDRTGEQSLIVKVEYGDAAFYSDPVQVVNLTAESEIYQKIIVYDTSKDLSKLTAERWHIYLDYSEKDVIKVLEFYIISNPGRFLIIPEEPNIPLLYFHLPQNAQNLQISDETKPVRTILTEDGFADISSIQPNSKTQIAFSFEVPYKMTGGFLKRSRQEFSLKPPLPVESAVVMKPNDDIFLEDSILKETGQKNMQGVDFQVYSTNNLQKDSALDFTLIDHSSFKDWNNIGSKFGVLLGAVALALAVLIAFISIVGIKNRRHLAQTSDLPDAKYTNHNGANLSGTVPYRLDELIDTILALDDAFQAGNIPEEAYRKRRAELKQKIKFIQEEQAKNH